MALHPLEYDHLLNLYRRADRTQKARFIDWAVGYSPDKPFRLSTVEEYLSKRSGTPTCPRCGSTSLVKNGRASGCQRWVCRKCKRTVGLAHGTLYSNTKKPLLVWEQFSRCMQKRMTLRQAARECNISLPTAFAWKKKYIAETVRFFTDQARDMQQSGMLPPEVDCEVIGKQVEAMARECFAAPRRRRGRRGSVITDFVPPHPYRP